MNQVVYLGTLTKNEVGVLAEKIMEISAIDDVMIKSMTRAGFIVDLDSVTISFDISGNQKIIESSNSDGVNPPTLRGGHSSKRKNPIFSDEEKSLCDRIKGHVQSLINHNCKIESIAKMIGVSKFTLIAWCNMRNVPRTISAVEKLFTLKPEVGKLGAPPIYCDLGKKIVTYCSTNNMSRKEFSELHELNLYELEKILKGEKMSDRIMEAVIRTVG